MSRAPVAAFLGLLLGTALAGLAIVLFAWVVITKLDVARGFDMAVWVARHAPDGVIPMPPDHFGNRVINSKMWVAAFGAIAGILAFNLLRGARRNLRPADQADDGSALLELEGPPPRVGHAVEGALVLAGAPQGDLYLLSLGCYGPEDSLLYEERMEARVMPGAKGARLPFRFEIPLTAPPTRERVFVHAPGARRWEIGYSRRGSWFGGSSVPLEVEPMDEAGARRFADLPKSVQREIDSGRSKLAPGQEKYYEEWQLRLGRFMDAHGWKVFAGAFFGSVLAMFVVFMLFKTWPE